MSPHPVHRREFLKLTGAAGAAALLGRAAGANPQDGRPNILFIMTDDHAAHALSCYGSRVNITPNMDRLAREGMRFTNCFVTNALCGPSRATLLTGKYSHANGLKDNFTDFDGSQTTFPKLLQKAGYRTAIVGKWHLRTDPTGFDYWNILPGQGMYKDPALIEMGIRKKHQGYVTDVITDIAIGKLKQWKGGRPWCMLLHHKAPHRNWQPDERHAPLFAGKDLPLPATFDDDYSGRASAAAHADMRIVDMPDYADEIPAGLTAEQRKRWNYQRFLKDYLRTIASVDDNIGRVLKYLDESGQAENTVVVYTADNGFFLGDHGWFDKRFMYEESLRVPLLVRFPGRIRPGSVCADIALNTDYAPTFLHYAGADVPSDMHGASLAPVLEGRTPADWRKSMYYHYYEYPQSHRVREHYGVRTGRYKLIHYYTVDEWELFDLQKDPHEMKSVYSDPAYRYTVQGLKAELSRLQRVLGDTTATAGSP